MLLKLFVVPDVSIMRHHNGEKDGYISHSYPNADESTFPFGPFIDVDMPLFDAMSPSIDAMVSSMHSWSTSYEGYTHSVLVDVQDELEFNLGILGVSGMMYLGYELSTGLMCVGTNQATVSRYAAEPGRINQTNTRSGRVGRVGRGGTPKVTPFFDFNNYNSRVDEDQEFYFMVEDDYHVDMTKIVLPHIENILMESFIKTTDIVYEGIFEDFLYDVSNDPMRRHPLLKYDEKRNSSLCIDECEVNVWEFTLTRCNRVLNKIYANNPKTKYRVNTMLNLFKMEVDKRELNADDE